MYWMRHLASLYFPYEKLLKSIYTAVKTVFKIRLTQNIQKNNKFSHKEAMWSKVHSISSVTLSFIYFLYVVQMKFQKDVLFPNNLPLKFYKSEKALLMTETNAVSWLLATWGWKELVLFLLFPQVKKKRDYRFFMPLNAPIQKRSISHAA